MKEITAERLASLEKDTEFLSRIRMAKTQEDALKVLSDYGIEMSQEEFEEGYEKASVIFEEKGYIRDGELTDDGMELVAGGMNTTVSMIGLTAGYVGLGMMMSGPVGLAAVGIWAGGCFLATCGVMMPGKKKKKRK